MVSVCPAVARVRVPGGVSRRVGESVSAMTETWIANEITCLEELHVGTTYVRRFDFLTF